MPVPQSASDRLISLKAELKELEQAALSELVEKRNSLSQQLAQVDSEIAALTGKPLESRGSRKRAAIVGKTPSFQELTDLLTAVPGKMLNLRKEGLEVKNIKMLAQTHPHLLKLGGKGAWPTVTLVK